MVVLYVVSSEKATGKTALCAGLAVNFRNEDKKVGYSKSRTIVIDGSDSDITFMKRLLETEDVVNESDIVKDRDIVLIEANVSASPEDLQTKETYAAVKEMQASVIAVESYSTPPSRYFDVYRNFGTAFLGVVVNKVPESQIDSFRDKIKNEFESTGIKLLGIIPENRVALAITVGELVEGIQGTVLDNAGKADELIENYMLGAMVLDSGIEYFNRKNCKAAIINKNRPDMQLAALDTSTVCLVLSGGGDHLVANVVEKARKKGIPLIATELSTSEIVDKIETTLGNRRMNQMKKTKRLAEMVKQNLDLKSIT